MNTNPFDQFELGSIGNEKMGADDPARLEELERILGKPLPAEYREFLLTKAPCDVKPELDFRPLEPNPWTSHGLNGFDVFYGLKEGDSYDVIRNYLRRDSGFTPAHMLPIGSLPSGSVLVMALDEPVGRILFLDCDSGEFFLCANSFIDFLKSFEEGAYA